MAVSYLRICCIISPGIVFFSVFEKALQATGLSLYSTIAQITGAVVNIVLDPILIYGLIGAPELGVKGAALATVLGQLVSFGAALLFHVKHNKAVKNSLKYMKPEKGVILAIYSIGLPAIIAQALMSVMTYGLNMILVQIDEGMVTAYGLFYKIQQFILFAAFGLRDAITPIVSFSRGMGSRERVQQGIKYGLIYTLANMAVGFAALEIFTYQLSSVFVLSDYTKEVFVSAIRIISISFLFAGFNIACQGIFQALDCGLQSLVVSLLRQLILVLPVTYILSVLAANDHDKAWTVWLTFPAAELVSACVSAFFLKQAKRAKINIIGQNSINESKNFS